MNQVVLIKLWDYLNSEENFVLSVEFSMIKRVRIMESKVPNQLRRDLLRWSLYSTAGFLPVEEFINRITNYTI